MREYDDLYDVPGRASKIDKWQYNDILNDIARQGWYNLGTKYFKNWAKRFYKALRVINTKNLPIRKYLDKKHDELRDIYDERVRWLKQREELWGNPVKRDDYLDRWEEEYWEDLFDYSLDLATQAGFTFHLENIDESVALRV